MRPGSGWADENERASYGTTAGQEQMATYGWCYVLKFNVQEASQRSVAQTVQEIS